MRKMPKIIKEPIKREETKRQTKQKFTQEAKNLWKTRLYKQTPWEGRTEKQERGGLCHDGRYKSKLMERVATIIETMFN